MARYFDFIDEANLPNPTYKETGSTHTAGYSAPNPPPLRQIPSHIVLDSQLPQKMRGCLRSYLTTRCGQRPVSDSLVSRLGLIREDLVQIPHDLTNEPTAIIFFADTVLNLVKAFVFDVDGVAAQLTEAPTSYGAKPDIILGGRVHVEFMSARALIHHVDEIINFGRENDGRGSALVLGAHEAEGRFIVFKIGISMVTNNLTWGILTSGLVSIFFHRHEVPDINGESHHILSCSEPVYVDAARPSVFSLCAAMLLGAHDACAFSLRPPNTTFTVQPYSLPPAASPSEATRSHTGRHRGSETIRLSSVENPRGSTSRKRQHLIKTPRTLLGVRRVATLEYRVRVRGRCQCLWKCPTLRVQFLTSYWPDVVYNVRRVRLGASLLSGHTGQATACRFPPPHLRLYERVGRGESGQVLNGTVYVPQSRTKHNVVAKLFLRSHLDKLHNEIHLYRTRLVVLRNKAVPKVFGAFVTRGSMAAAVKTMEKWGIIVMEKCGSVVQSVDELTVDQREAAYRCLCLIHQAGVEHCDFHLNNILFSSDGVRVIDFSEAVEHDCSGPNCYELRRAREYLELLPRLTS